MYAQNLGILYSLPSARLHTLLTTHSSTTYARFFYPWNRYRMIENNVSLSVLLAIISGKTKLKLNFLLTFSSLSASWAPPFLMWQPRSLTHVSLHFLMIFFRLLRVYVLMHAPFARCNMVMLRNFVINVAFFISCRIL